MVLGRSPQKRSKDIQEFPFSFTGEMTKANTLALGFTVLSILPGAAITAADDDGFNEVIQEFSIAETAFPQKKGEIQITSGFEYWKEGSMRGTGVPLVLEYGVTNRFQVGIDIPYYFIKTEAGGRVSGVGDIETGFLYSLLKEDDPVAISVAADAGWASGNEEKELGEGETELGASVLLAKGIGKGQVHLGLGGEFGGDKAGFVYNLAGVYPFHNFRALLELNGLSSDEHALYLTPGLIWKGLDGIMEDLELGVGFAGGLTPDAADHKLIFKVTCEF